MLVLEGRRKPDYLEKILSEQDLEKSTNSNHIRLHRRENIALRGRQKNVAKRLLPPSRFSIMHEPITFLT